MFDEKDVEKMEAFAMFCGIGIHNTKTYESTCKLMAKQVFDYSQFWETYKL